jgi:hypothetical protein
MPLSIKDATVTALALVSNTNVELEVLLTTGLFKLLSVCICYDLSKKSIIAASAPFFMLHNT